MGQDAVPTADDVNAAWQQALGHGAYAHHCRTWREFLRLMRLGRAWSRILDEVRPPRGGHVFELGCGGGINLAKLALRGYAVHGIDVSADVAERARSFLAEVAHFRAIRATVEVADIFRYESSSTYDMVFHNGVVEHFLDGDDRAAIWRQLVRLTKPGGAVVSIVPCGAHVMRPRVRAERLCGYDIAEIDYTCASHTEELRAAGLHEIRCIPSNYFDFLRGHPNRWVQRYAHPVGLIAGNLLLAHAPLPDEWKERVADSLIVIGRTPVR